MKKKRLYKIITALLSFILISALLSICVFADHQEENGTYYSAADSVISAGDATEDKDITGDATEDSETDEGEATGGTEDNNGTGENGLSENIFDVAYAFLLENSDKIFSLLSFIASLVIAFLYKKNLLPTVKGSVNTLAAAVSEFRLESEKEISSATGAVLAANARLLETENVLMSISEELSRVEEALENRKSDEREREEIKTLISAEVDMLYEIFMQSSLPQYQKDSVSERIADMKKSLSEGVGYEG